MEVKKVCIYTRVSTRKQANEPSLDGQEATCRTFVQKQEGWEVAHVAREVKSGKDGNRPIWRRICLDTLEGKYNIILVRSFDRFARNVVLAVTEKKMLRDAGADVVSVNENLSLEKDDPNRYFVEGTLDLLSEWFLIQLSQKTRAAQIARLEKGKYPSGSILWGYHRVNGVIVPQEPYFSWVQLTFDEFETEKYSISDWVSESYKRGIRSRRGNKISKSNWHNYLTNPWYIGKMKWLGVVYPGIHQPAVTREQFMNVQDIIEKRSTGKKRYVHAYYFSGLLWSADASSTMYSETQGVNKYYYSKKKAPYGKAHYIDEAKVETLFQTALGNLQVNIAEVEASPLIKMAIKAAPNLCIAFDCMESFDDKREFIRTVVQRHGIQI